MERLNCSHDSNRFVDSSEDLEKLFVATLNQLRHDWMNDIQVMYGYLQLKKYDKMYEFMETIKQRIARDSSVSRLGAPSLILYLSTFRVRHKSVSLEVELEPGLQLTSLPVSQRCVTDTVVQVGETFVRHAGVPDNGGLNSLLLALSALPGHLNLVFEFTGAYIGKALDRDLQAVREAWREVPGFAFSGTYHEEKAVVTIQIPFDRENEVCHVSG
jgi:hypothetical protein